MSEKLKALRGRVIGDNWPNTRRRLAHAIKQQEELIGLLCDIEEVIDPWDLEDYVREARRREASEQVRGGFDG